MSKLFSNGCSFLSTRPKDGVHTFVTQILAKQYNLQLFNLAMGGRGNDRISFTTKVWFEQNRHQDTFAVIGWSSSHRNDYVTNDGWKKGRIPGTELTWRTWKTVDNVRFIEGKPGWDIENNAIMSFLDNVFDLQNYFERNKIPYVMYNALPNDSKSKVKKDWWRHGSHDFDIIAKAINMDRFFKFDTSHLEYIMDGKLNASPSVKHLVTNKLRKKNSTNELIVSPKDPHPSVKGHTQWANELKEFIDVNNLRTI